MGEDISQGPGRTQATLGVLYLTASLALTLWLLWSLIPEHQRKAMSMRLLRSSAQVTRGLARRAAERSMRLELATWADDRPGLQSYDLPLWLSCRALQLEAAYDRQRGVTS